MGRRYRFGLPGDGINGIMESLRQRQDRIRFVQVRHEETAALMAGGYAKLTGRLGVCLATFEQTKNLVEALARQDRLGCETGSASFLRTSPRT